MITFHDVTLQRGTNVLFAGVNFSLFNHQKIGIVGSNGCGKTSLFLLILKKLEASSGSVTLSSRLSVVTVEQEVLVSEQSAIEYVIDADEVLRSYEKALRQAEQLQDGEAIARFYDMFLHRDGFTATARAAKILHGLGFSEAEMNKSVQALSGGWRMRLNIARALFVPSDILLLDEPTNHLDLDAVIWLEKWLQRYPGLLLLISHDREFLDRIVTHILHIKNQRIKLYTGNYSTFEEERALLLARQEKQYEKQQKQIEHIEAYIKRFRFKATKARQAQSRVKVLEKMKRIIPVYVDSPFCFEFKEPQRLSHPLLVLENIDFGYEENLVLVRVNFQLNSGDRIGLLGRNGAGKSTFIKLLAGLLNPCRGRLAKNNKLQIGYFSQHTLELLNEEENALTHLQKLAPTEMEVNLRKFLGGFNFTGDKVGDPIKNFSGGEKTRLALALIIWQAPHLLLLDEPTNHLDLEMRHALILALQNFSGALVLVSHDRFLLNQVIDDYYLVDHQTVRKFHGGVDAYYEWLIQGDSVHGSTGVQAGKSISKKQARSRVEIKAKKSLLQRQIRQWEEKLAALQKEIETFDRQLIELSSNAIQSGEMINRLQVSRAKMVRQYQEGEKTWLDMMEHFEQDG